MISFPQRLRLSAPPTIAPATQTNLSPCLTPLRATTEPPIQREFLPQSE